MPLRLLSGPAAEPITLAEAKTYLRVEHGDEDALIASLIAAARGQIETLTRRVLINQTWRLVLDAWPADGRMTLPLAPLREVVAARVYDGAGLAHDLDTEVFVADTAGARIAFPPWSVFPPGRESAGIELDIACGYGPTASTTPEPLRQAVRLWLAHAYENRGLAGEARGVAPFGLQALIAPYRLLAL